MTDEDSLLSHAGAPLLDGAGAGTASVVEEIWGQSIWRPRHRPTPSTSMHKTYAPRAQLLSGLEEGHLVPMEDGVFASDYPVAASEDPDKRKGLFPVEQVLDISDLPIQGAVEAEPNAEAQPVGSQNAQLQVNDRRFPDEVVPKADVKERSAREEGGRDRPEAVETASRASYAKREILPEPVDNLFLPASDHASSREKPAGSTLRASFNKPAATTTQSRAPRTDIEDELQAISEPVRDTAPTNEKGSVQKPVIMPGQERSVIQPNLRAPSSPAFVSSVRRPAQKTILKSPENAHRQLEYPPTAEVPRGASPVHVDSRVPSKINSDQFDARIILKNQTGRKDHAQSSQNEKRVHIANLQIRVTAPVKPATNENMQKEVFSSGVQGQSQRESTPLRDPWAGYNNIFY